MNPADPEAPRTKKQTGKAGKLARDMALYSTLLFILPSCVLAGYWIGAALDSWFGTAPVLAMVFLLLGAAVGFFQMYRIISKV